MFPEMRRRDRAMTPDETQALLDGCEYGVLTVNGLNGYPHSIPMSYACKGGAIWFHCALEGVKLDCLRADSRATFAVVSGTQVIPEKFTTNYSSAICYGSLTEVTGAEAGFGLMALVEKYSPGFVAEGQAYIDRVKAKTGVLKFKIEHMTGKARR